MGFVGMATIGSVPVSSSFKKRFTRSKSSDDDDKPVASSVDGGTITKRESEVGKTFADAERRSSRSRSSGGGSSSRTRSSQTQSTKSSTSPPDTPQPETTEPTPQPTPTQTQQQNVKQSTFNAQTGSFNPNVGYEVTTKEGVSYSTTARGAEMAQVRNRLTTPTPVASSELGGSLTRKQAETIKRNVQRQKEFRRTTITLDPSTGYSENIFFTKEGQRAALKRVPDTFIGIGRQVKNIPTRVGNLFRRDDKPLPVDTSRVDPVTKFITDPITVASAPLSGPAQTTRAVGGFVIGVAATTAVKKGGEKLQQSRFQVREFQQSNPELAAQASQAGREAVRTQQREEYGFVRGKFLPFIGLEQTSGSTQTFIQGGEQFLVDRGVRGEQLEQGRKFLAAEARLNPATEVTGLLVTETAGNIGGEGILTGSIRRGVSRAESSTARSFVGGLSEGATAVGTQSIAENREIDPLQVASGAAIGGITAGAIEFGRTSKAVPKGVRRGVNVGANVVEPQEFVVDTAQSGIERLGRGRSRATSPSFGSGTSKSRTQQTRSITIDVAKNQDTFGATQQPSPARDDSFSFTEVKDTTKDTTKTNENSQQFSESLVQPNVKTNTRSLANTKSLASTNTKTIAFTTPPPFIPLGFGGRFGSRKRRSRSVQSKSYSPSAFSVIGNIRGKSTKGGIATGLGLRPLQPTTKKKKKRGTKLPKF